jgi:hypothetical protein
MDRGEKRRWACVCVHEVQTARSVTFRGSRCQLQCVGEPMHMRSKFRGPPHRTISAGEDFCYRQGFHAHTGLLPGWAKGVRSCGHAAAPCNRAWPNKARAARRRVAHHSSEQLMHALIVWRRVFRQHESGRVVAMTRTDGVATSSGQDCSVPEEAPSGRPMHWRPAALSSYESSSSARQNNMYLYLRAHVHARIAVATATLALNGAWHYANENPHDSSLSSSALLPF